MSGVESDSMWLQKSITLPDPLPNDDTLSTLHEEPLAEKKMSTDAPPSLPETEDKVPSLSAMEKKMQTEMDLTKMVLETATILNNAQRPSTTRYSTRMSLPNAAFITAQDYDDLRSRYSQTRRELLKVSDIQKDLEFARFELTRAQEEIKLMRRSNDGLKKDMEDATERAEKATRAYAALERKLSEENALYAKEIEFLRRQIEDLRRENTTKLAVFTEQQEYENQGRIQSLREELASVTAELEAMCREIAMLRQEKCSMEQQHACATREFESAQESIAELQKKLAATQSQFHELEEQHQDHLRRLKAEQEGALQAQRSFAEEHVRQITESKNVYIKELEGDMQKMSQKLRTATDDLATLRRSYEQLSDELKMLSATHAKDLRRAAEEHQVNLCEKELQMESALREARTSMATAEEENQSLRRQLAKVSEELSTIATVLAQRERRLSECEKELGAFKEKALRLEEENAKLISDAEFNYTAADEANARFAKLNEERDALEEAYASDLHATKERIRSLEESLMANCEELSSLRKERIESSDAARATTRELRARVDAVVAERDHLLRELQAKQHNEEVSEEMRQKYLREKQRAENLNVELTAAIHRCTSLEKRLDDALRRQIACAKLKSPSTNPTNGPFHAGLRSTETLNAQPRSPRSMKRARTQDARVFAISGFDGNDLLLSLKQLPDVAIAECKSNMPVPSNLTHLITNGQLTIKLLTALVRGCWILPESYVTESLKQRRWLSETDFGFQHEFPPLLKKHIHVTELFTTSKHYGTATLLLKEGGAIVVDDPQDANWVLCINTELPQYERGINWEKMVEVIYPVRIE